MPIPDDLDPFKNMTLENRSVTCRNAGCPEQGKPLTVLVAVGPNCGPITVLCPGCSTVIADVAHPEPAPTPGPDQGPDPE